MFFVAGIGVAVFIEFLLVSKKNKTTADRILTLWMFLMAFHLFLMYLSFTQDIYRFPFLLGIDHPLPLLHGVFLYLYVSLLTKQFPGRRLFAMLHFLPAILIYLYLIPFFLTPAAQKIEVYRNHGAGYEVFMMVKYYAIVISGISYVSWSAWLLRKHRLNIRDQFSDLERINLRWLQVLTIGLGGIWFLVIFFSDETLIMEGVVVFVFLIGFFGVRQTDIFTSSTPAAEDVEEDAEEKKKYSKSGLTEESSGELHRNLTKLMTEEALYKKSELSINELASRLQVHPNYLSQIINQREKKNFYDFVNTYRIEEFKRQIAMSKNQQYTLLSLAYDCGFSSKSAFNRYFKKVTGKTPSEFATAVAGGSALLS